MEFDLIERIRRRVIARDDVVLGIGDDAALLQVPANRQLVVAMDTLNAGVHFPDGTAPAHIGWKALAVNLSDLAAMGATPAWCTLSLSLPQADADWLDGFLDGFCALAAREGVALVGGDTTRGPLSICVTVHGFVAPDAALRRDRARVGDDIWVSGTLGDAAAALALKGFGPVRVDARASSADTAVLALRLDRPEPRVALGGRLAGLANAAIDISDGLLSDLGHVARASGVRIVVDVDALPSSPPFAGLFDTPTRRLLQASGGDDYELCFTAPVGARERILHMANDVPVTLIGRVLEGETGVDARDVNGAPWRPERSGFVHFAG